MNLRSQHKSTNINKGESIQEYLIRVSQFKEQLEAIEDKIDEDELLMTTLIVLLDHGIHTSIQSVQGRKAYNLMSYGKNTFKMKLE